MTATLTDLAGTRWYVPAGAGKQGVLIIRLEGCAWPLFPAYSTAEGCQAAIEQWWPGHVVLEISNPTRFNAGATRKGITVAVDLQRDELGWGFHRFTPALLSPGGEA